MRLTVKIASATIAVVIFIAGLILLLRWIFADPTGAVEQRESTVGNGAYRISSYDSFYDQCFAAKTTQENIANAIVMRDTETDPARQAQLNVNVIALQNELNSEVNQYNSDARKADTKAHFKASDLPYSLNAKEVISCTA
jgi:hypothetical protein